MRDYVVFQRIELQNGDTYFRVKAYKRYSKAIANNACKRFPDFATIQSANLSDRILGGLRRGETWHIDCHVWNADKRVNSR